MFLFFCLHKPGAIDGSNNLLAIASGASRVLCKNISTNFQANSGFANLKLYRKQ